MKRRVPAGYSTRVAHAEGGDGGLTAGSEVIIEARKGQSSITIARVRMSILQ